MKKARIRHTEKRQKKVDTCFLILKLSHRLLTISQTITNNDSSINNKISIKQYLLGFGVLLGV
jgi:hypothetical protein